MLKLLLVLLIGLVFEFQQNFLSWTGRWTTAPLAIPQIMLFLALLFLPQARIEGKKLIRQVAPRIPSISKAILGMGVLFVVVAALGLIFQRTDVRTLTQSLIFMMIGMQVMRHRYEGVWIALAVAMLATLAGRALAQLSCDGSSHGVPDVHHLSGIGENETDRRHGQSFTSARSCVVPRSSLR